jgi:hypothetical protein
MAFAFRSKPFNCFSHLLICPLWPAQSQRAAIKGIKENVSDLREGISIMKKE